MEVTQRTNGSRELAKRQEQLEHGFRQNHLMILLIFKKMRAHQSARNPIIPMMGGGSASVIHPVKEQCKLGLCNLRVTLYRVIQ